MNDKKREISSRQRRPCENDKEKMIAISVVLGVVVLIVLLLFWVDVADILGWGDGAA